MLDVARAMQPKAIQDHYLRLSTTYRSETPDWQMSG
jgi:hypothetical protein